MGVTLLSSTKLWEQHTVTSWNGIDLTALNSLTSWSYYYTLDNSLVEGDLNIMTKRTPLFEVDFATVSPLQSFRGTLELEALSTGPVHAVVITWEVFDKSQSF